MDQEQKLDQEQEQVQNIVFKTTAVGGFEKRAVLDYIYDMNEKMETERAELLNRIGDLEESRQALEENSSQYNNKMRTLERDLATVSNELSNEKHKRLELESYSNDFSVEVEGYKTQIEEIRRQKLAPKELSLEETERFKQLEQLEARKEEIDKASYQVGRVMLDARADADCMVDAAKEQSGNIVAAAKEDAQNILNDANSKSAEIIRDAEKSAEEIIKASHVEDERIRSEAKKEDERIRSEAQREDERIRSEAKKEDERIRSEATKYSEVKISAANTEVDRVMSTANQNITEMLSASEEVAKISDKELAELKSETDSITASVKEALTQLLDKTASLDKLILSAKSRIGSEQSQMAKNKLADISGMAVEELEVMASIKAEKPEEEAVINTVEIAEETYEVEPTIEFMADMPAKEDKMEAAVVEEVLVEAVKEEEIPRVLYDETVFSHLPEESIIEETNQVTSEAVTLNIVEEPEIRVDEKIVPLTETLVKEDKKEVEKDKSFHKSSREKESHCIPYDYNTQLKSTIEDEPAKPAPKENQFDFEASEPIIETEYLKVEAEDEKPAEPKPEVKKEEEPDCEKVRSNYEEDGLYAPREENDNPDQPVGSQSGLLDFTV